MGYPEQEFQAGAERTGSQVHNSDLIKQVNANHQSKIPDNLVKNVSLIREINGNITKVMSIYSDLSFNVSNIVEERRRLKNGGESKLESASNES